MGLFSKLFGGRRRAGDDDAKPALAEDNDFWFTADGRSRTSVAGVKVTADRALRNDAVWACVNVIASAIATAPLGIFKNLSDGGVESASDHPLDELIRFQPNKTQTAVEFWETMILHAALRGRAYAEIKPGPRGAVDQLIPIHPDRVTQDLLPDGTLRFKITDPRTFETRTLLQEEVFRISGISSDGITPLRPVELAADTIGLAMAADEYAGRVFSQNLNMGGFLSHPGKIGKEAIQRLIARLEQRFAGPKNFHRPMILQDGMKYEKASMTAGEAQLQEARENQIRAIARRWHIPLHMLGMDDQTNRSTVEEQSINFVKYTLRPWCRRIEQAIRRDLIIAKRLYEAKFNLDAIQRGNTQTVAESMSKALGAGGSPPWMTQNEVRVLLGMNRRPEPHADELAVGTNPAGDSASGDAPPPAADKEDDNAAIIAAVPELLLLEPPAEGAETKEDGEEDTVAPPIIVNLTVNMAPSSVDVKVDTNATHDGQPTVNVLQLPALADGSESSAAESSDATAVAVAEPDSEPAQSDLSTPPKVADDGGAEADVASVEAEADRLAQKECKAIRGALMRFGADAQDFRVWVGAFYGGHVSEVMKAFDWPKPIAKLYCDSQKNALLSANDWVAVVDQWDEALAGEIVKAVTTGETNG